MPPPQKRLTSGNERRQKCPGKAEDKGESERTFSAGRFVYQDGQDRCSDDGHETVNTEQSGSESLRLAHVGLEASLEDEGQDRNHEAIEKIFCSENVRKHRLDRCGCGGALPVNKAMHAAHIFKRLDERHAQPRKNLVAAITAAVTTVSDEKMIIKKPRSAIGRPR